MIKFRCQHCKNPLSVREHLAGKKASCPKCKKPIVIPVPATPAPSKVASVPPDEPPVDVEAVAAAALHEDAPTNGKQEVSATIDFRCELCDTELHVPREDAGKRMQCPNPECRGLIKVPSPKDGQPKALPTVAQLTQPEKIDEAAWGTHTDKGRVTQGSLIEAGAIPEAPKAPVSPRVMIGRVLWTIGGVAAFALVAVVALRARNTQQQKDFVREAMQYVEPPKGAKADDLLKDPIARAAVYKAIGDYKVRRQRKNSEVLDAFKKALASARPAPGTKPATVEGDLFLGELALSLVELGGTEDEERSLEKYQWTGNTLREEMTRVIESIQAPEARVIALRNLSTRLLEKDQAELAISVASQFSNKEKGGRQPLALSQLIVLLLLKNQPLDKYDIKAPDFNKEPPGILPRLGFAEFHARKGNFTEANNLCLARATAPEQFVTCVSVAQAILQDKAKSAEAAPFVEKALEVLAKPNDAKQCPPWYVLQAVRVGARVKGKDAALEVVKLLPAAFKPRGMLEIVLAEADTSKVALGPSALKDLAEASPDSASLELGWEALARQNARLRADELRSELAREENRRFRAMVHIGEALGAE
jgi:hypothetical protein